MPAGPAAEERALAELGSAVVASAVLHDVGRACSGRVKPLDDRSVSALHLPVNGAPQPAESKAGRHRLPRAEVDPCPGAGVMWLEPVRMLAELGVLTACRGRVVRPQGV